MRCLAIRNGSLPTPDQPDFLSEDEEAVDGLLSLDDLVSLDDLLSLDDDLLSPPPDVPFPSDFEPALEAPSDFGPAAEPLA